MSYELIYRVDLGSAQSPFRVVAQPTAREVGWINRFLERKIAFRVTAAREKSYGTYSGRG